MTFREKLVILRKTRKLTQDDFASAVGVSRQAVYKWECGQSYPEVPKLLEIKFLFGISIDDLLDDTFEIALPEKKKRRRRKTEDAPAVETKVVEEKVAEKVVEKVEKPKDPTEVTLASLLADLEKRTAKMLSKEEAEPAKPAAPKKEKEAEPVLVAPAPALTPNAAPVAEADAEEVVEKKKGLFGRLFGKK